MEKEISRRIAIICGEYGYTRCPECPLYEACSIERKADETQTEFTIRWENGMEKAHNQMQNGGNGNDRK